MDTSKIYIKMCDCPEIQREKDDFRDANGLLNDTAYNKPLNKGGKLIWLPSQDEIQEMLFEEDFTPLRVLHAYGHSKYFQYMGSRIASFRNESREIWNYFIEFTSMEQLWLAFYMRETHKKTWDGNKWQ